MSPNFLQMQATTGNPTVGLVLHSSGLLESGLDIGQPNRAQSMHQSMWFLSSPILGPIL